MAELINKKDNLNKGRIKINKSIEASERSEIKSDTSLAKSEQALSNSENTQEQLDTIVIDGDSSVEAAQARVDESGETFSTLKERIDSGFDRDAEKLEGLESWLKKTSGVVVTDFGAVGNGVQDDTESINNAIEYAADNGLDNVFIPKGEYLIDPGEYNHVPQGDVGGIQLKSNVNITMSSSATIKSKPMSTDGYNIIAGRQVENVIIDGGNVVGERDEHIGSGGEYGHGINLMSCNNITVKNVKVSDCWGDGIYVGGKDGASKEINFKNVKSINNRRQGISITHVDGMSIKDSEFSDTFGTSPQAGIDIEPNNNEVTVNIVINNVKCMFNNTYGIQIYTRADTNSVVKNIEIKDLQVVGGERGIAVREMGGSISDLLFRNVELVDNASRGFWISDGNVERVNVNGLLIKDTPEGMELRDIEDLTIINMVMKGTETQGVRLRNSNNVILKDLNIKNVIELPDSPESGGIPAGIWVQDSNYVTITESVFANIDINAIRFSNVNKSSVRVVETTGIKEDVVQISGGSQIDLTDLIVTNNKFKENDVYRFLNVSGGTKNSSFRNIIATTDIISARYGVQLSASVKEVYVDGVYAKNATNRRAFVDGGTDNLSNNIIGKEEDQE